MFLQPTIDFRAAGKLITGPSEMEVTITKSRFEIFDFLALFAVEISDPVGNKLSTTAKKVRSSHPLHSGKHNL